MNEICKTGNSLRIETSKLSIWKVFTVSKTCISSANKDNAMLEVAAMLSCFSQLVKNGMTMSSSMQF